MRGHFYLFIFKRRYLSPKHEAEFYVLVAPWFQGMVTFCLRIPLMGFSVAGEKEEALLRVLFKAWGRSGPGWLVVQSMRI